MPARTSSRRARSSSRKATPRKASGMSPEIKGLIEEHGLQPHPEGGFYVETYKSDHEVNTAKGPRASSTAIKFLVTKGSVSRLHRLESDELWHFYSGGPLVVVELDDEEEGHVRTTVLGPDDENQYICKAGVWFGSFPAEGTEWSLVGCTVSPGFDFEDFELAQPSVLKEEFPEATDMIEKLTIGLKDKKAPMKKETKRGRSAPLLMDHPVFRASPSEKPRQLILSLIMFTCIMYFGWSSRSFDSDQEAFRSATVFVFVAFEMFIFLQVRDLLTVWPHPGFWRLIFGAGAFYALVLVSMLMLDFVRARWILESLLGDIGSFSSYEKKTEAIKEDVMGTCSMTWQSAPQVLFNQIFMAPWFLSHALGWMGKMMIFRDWKVCLIGAFLFECTEATLCYVCPEFEECWWDSIFLDTFGANLLGMWVGTHVNRWMVTYSKKESSVIKGGDKKVISRAQAWGAKLDWAGKAGRATDTEKLASALNPLIHDSTYKWSIMASPLRMMQVGVLIGGMLFIETNTFLMMNTIGIPHDSWYNKARLALFGFLCVPAAAEWYVYVEQTSKAGADVARIGPACWLCISIALLEHCLFWKFFPKHFVAELDKLHGWILIPTDTLVKHLSASLLFLTWAFLRYKVFGYGVNEEGLNAKERKQVKKVVKNIEKRGRRNSILAEVPENVKTQIFLTEAVDILLYLSIVPLVALGTNWKWD
ncbi:hypothetical protein TrCOL_g4098 [Triparma columacea]|uniref:DUF985 domain-containing protein n=1 Tax=Triparma columacea TaxID=722753 RepID=A0A9W7FYN9_9STRA|nr:hypothetical protein TrCOL_g4098 [Triparma columacea]